MDQTIILYPITSLVAWTFVVLLIIPYQRFKAVFAKDLKFDDFKLGESSDVPASVSLPNRNYMNLLELPVLFYVACLVSYVSGVTDQFIIVFAWIYVVLRVVHSMIHLTYNNVLHRVIFFAMSNMVLAILWVRLFFGFSNA